MHRSSRLLAGWPTSDSRRSGEAVDHAPVDGYLDALRVGRQLQDAGAPALAHGVRDELGHDQGPGIRGLRGRRRPTETAEEGARGILGLPLTGEPENL